MIFSNTWQRLVGCLGIGLLGASVVVCPWIEVEYRYETWVRNEDWRNGVISQGDVSAEYNASEMVVLELQTFQRDAYSLFWIRPERPSVHTRLFAPGIAFAVEEYGYRINTPKLVHQALMILIATSACVALLRPSWSNYQRTLLCALAASLMTIVNMVGVQLDYSRHSAVNAGLLIWAVTPYVWLAALGSVVRSNATLVRATLIRLLVIALPGLILASPWAYSEPSGGWFELPWNGNLPFVIVPILQGTVCLLVSIAILVAFWRTRTSTYR
jgi:hypothetical protein